MPLDKLPVEVIRTILAGGESVCAAAGIPVAGGHSIDTLEPIYGLVALGPGASGPREAQRPRARPGDVLILGKPLGVGILSAALKKGKLSAEGYARDDRRDHAAQHAGRRAGRRWPRVHAITDVTGFGLAGHLLEICRGSKLARDGALRRPAAHRRGAPLGRGRAWPPARPTATGRATAATCASPPARPSGSASCVTDPQTSGGLLVACAPEAVDAVLAEFRRDGFGEARVIGELAEGAATVTVA